HRRENDRRDHHANQPDESIAERFELKSDFWEEMPNKDAQNHPDQNPKIELRIERFSTHWASGMECKRKAVCLTRKSPEQSRWCVTRHTHHSSQANFFNRRFEKNHSDSLCPTPSDRTAALLCTKKMINV